MVNIIVLGTTLLLFLLVMTLVIRSVVQKISIIGRPPIPVAFFILAKMLVLVNLSFLLMKGLKINVLRLFDPIPLIDYIALAFLLTGTMMIFCTTIQLNRDLIFGLSDSEKHKLQTRGLFSMSRHPFYLGFILILFSSCLLYPNLVNFLAFLGAWIIHHFIMIGEEKFLESRYGDEYRNYKKVTRRYLTFKINKS